MTRAHRHPARVVAIDDLSGLPPDRRTHCAPGTSPPAREGVWGEALTDERRILATQVVPSVHRITTRVGIGPMYICRCGGNGERMTPRGRRTLAALASGALIALALPALEAQAAAPLCWGKVPTIVGTPGNDVLRGRSDVADVIWGDGGDDDILGGEFYSDLATAKPDLLCGGPGNDKVYGGPADDKINGGDGNDWTDGRYGNDIVQGNAGDDRVADPSFDDMMSGDDVMRGGIGNDSLTIGAGVDKVYGGAGNDTIVDWECDTSYIYGGPGNDYIESYQSSFFGGNCGTARDYVYGNEHIDSAVVNAGDTVGTVEKITRVTT